MQQPDRLIRERDLKDYDGFGPTWRWDCIARGEYPKPIKLSEGGRYKGWLSRDIAAWQRWREARRDGKAGPDSSWKDFLAKPGDAAAAPVANAPPSPPVSPRPTTKRGVQ